MLLLFTGEAYEHANWAEACGSRKTIGEDERFCSLLVPSVCPPLMYVQHSNNTPTGFSHWCVPVPHARVTHTRTAHR